MIGSIIEQSPPVAPTTSITQLDMSTPWVSFVLLALTFLALPALIRLIRRIDAGDPSVGVGWRARHLGYVVAIILMARIVTGALSPNTDLHEGSRDMSVVMAFSTAILGSGALAALVIAYRLGPDRLRSIGLRAGHVLRAPLAGIVLYVLCLPAIIGVGHIWVWILGLCGVTEFEQPIALDLAKIAPGERLVPVVLGVLVLPFCEEILFRGFLQGFATKRLGSVGGIFVTSACFGLIHGREACLPIFALSCVLGFVMFHTQRLHAAWTVHALHNGVQFAAMFAFPETVGHNLNPGLLAGWFPSGS